MKSLADKQAAMRGRVKRRSFSPDHRSKLRAAHANRLNSWTDQQFEEFLAKRYPSGWQTMLLDPAVVYQACDAIMTVTPQ
jgi:hypothetical protein